jgi:uncharacterized membrane protein YgaE (UPF0421/DUF939 family)
MNEDNKSGTLHKGKAENTSADMTETINEGNKTATISEDMSETMKEGDKTRAIENSKGNNSRTDTMEIMSDKKTTTTIEDKNKTVQENSNKTTNNLSNRTEKNNSGK